MYAYLDAPSCPLGAHGLLVICRYVMIAANKCKLCGSRTIPCKSAWTFGGRALVFQL